jgi:hypothetical protein
MARVRLGPQEAEGVGAARCALARKRSDLLEDCTVSDLQGAGWA